MIFETIDLSGLEAATLHPAWGFAATYQSWCAELTVWRLACDRCAIAGKDGGRMAVKEKHQ